MQINQDDILFSMDLCLQSIGNKYLNREADILKENNTFSEYDVADLFKRMSRDNILKSKYGIRIVQEMVFTAISQYHEQLREKLLEFGIDIGEFDEKSTPLRDGYNKLKSLDE